MKKTMMTGLAVLLGLLVTSGVYAMGPYGHRGQGFTAITNLNVESVKKFLKDTSAERDALIIKRIELMKAYKNDPSDYNKIGTLKKQIIDLQTKVMDSAKEYGLDHVIVEWLTMRHKMMEHRGMGMMDGRGMGPGMRCGPCSSPK